MNVKLLRRIKKHILAEPMRYDQNAIVSIGTPGATVPVNDDRTYPACGTVACIGGWALILGAKRPPKTWQDHLNYRRLGRLLGITPRQVGRLCAYTTDREDSWSWPEQFANKYNRLKSLKAKANVAAKRIDHFIATKGAE